MKKNYSFLSVIVQAIHVNDEQLVFHRYDLISDNKSYNTYRQPIPGFDELLDVCNN